MKPFYFLVALATTLAFTSCQSKDSVEKGLCALMDDEVFKNYCYEHFDTNKDGELSQEEADAVRSIDISGLNVRSLKGIEHFANLERIEATVCKHLREVVIPITVTSIGDDAFSGCLNLESVTISKRVTSIGDNAFDGCLSLESVIIPKRVTSIGDYAFCNCCSLESMIIPDGVSSIGYYAFSDCDNLTSVTIPKSVTSIGRGAFDGCTGELIVNCNIPSVAGWDEGVFYGSKFTSVIIGDGVTSIGECAFRFCDKLTSFYSKFASADNRCLIIDGVLNSFAPAGLTEYTIPDGVATIGDYAFDGCKNLTSITIPDGVTSIGWGAFFDCDNLTSITIPDGVTSIGYMAFKYCENLKSVTIPKSVTSIGSRAFSYCDNLTSFYGKFASADNRCLIVDGVLTAFAPAGLTEYTIPDSVTWIGGSAFEDCKNLTSITIPDGVTAIGNWTFKYCENLKSVYCKATTPPMGGRDMFDGNASGRKIYVPMNSVEAYKVANMWKEYADDIVGYDF